MPTDKIKDVYDLISDKGYFTDENEFRSYVNDPKKIKEVYSLIQDDGFFKDEKEFESYFSDVKKKETFGLGYKKPSEAMRMGGLPKQEKLSQSPLKTAATTTPSVSTKPKKNIDYLTDINNLYKEKVSTSQERVNTKKELLNLQPQIENAYSQIEELNAIYNDVNLPIQERNEAAKSANLLLEQVQPIKSKYDELGLKYNDLVQKDKQAISKLKELDNQRQLQLQKEFSIGKDLLEKTGKGFVDAAAGVAGIFNTLGLSGDTEGGDDYDQEEVKQQTRQNIDKIRAFGNSLVTQETPQEWQSVFKGKFSPKKLAYITSQAVSSTVPTVAAGLFTGGAGTALAGAGMGFNESKDILKEAGLNDTQAEWASLGLSIPLGLLEEYGAGDVVKILSSPMVKKKVANELVKNIAGKQITKELLFNETKKSLGKVIADNAGSILTTGVKEAGTEVGQGTLQEIAKQTAQEYTGVNPDEQMPFEEYLKEFATQRGEEAVGGFLGGTALSGVGKALQVGLSGFKPNFTPSVYAQVKEFKDPDKLQEFEQDLQEEMEQGIITPEQVDEVMKNVQAIKEADDLIPNNITDNDVRAKAVNLIIEKNNIEKDIEGKDKSLVTPQSERLKEIDEQLVSISKGKIIEEQLTEEQDEQGRIEEPINRGTDVLEEGIGVAVEPNKEGIAGEDIQTETVPQAPLEEQKSDIEIRIEELQSELDNYNLKPLQLNMSDSEYKDLLDQQEQRVSEIKAELLALEKQQVPEVVSETVSEIEPPVVEETTADVGGVKPPDVSPALADVESTAKALDGKNEGKAESPTKESVTERLDINNPFYKKVEDALVKLGLIEKYNPETKTGDVIGGYVQSDGRGGFASGDMYFEVDGVIKYRKDGNVVEFDRNGNVVSENTQNVKSENAKTEIEGRKKSIQFLKDTRDSDAFKYKEVTEFDKLGNRKKIKRLKTDEELKESTNKINEQIGKAEKELAELVKAVEELLGAPTVSETTTTETEVTPTETKEVVSETVSEIEPPVVEETTADVGGVTSPDVSEIGGVDVDIERNYNNQINEKGFADVFIFDDLVINGVPKNTYKVRIGKDGGIVYYDANGKEVGRNKKATKSDFISISEKVVKYYNSKKTPQSETKPSESARKSENLAISKEEPTPPKEEGEGDFEARQEKAKEETAEVRKENNNISYRQAVNLVNKYVREVKPNETITPQEIQQAFQNKEQGNTREGWTQPSKEGGEEAPKQVKETGRTVSYKEGKTAASKEYRDEVSVKPEYYEVMNRQDNLKLALDYLDKFGDTEQGLIDAYNDMTLVFSQNPILDAKNAVAIEVLADRMFAKAMDFEMEGNKEKANDFITRSEQLRKSAFLAQYKAGQYTSAIAILTRASNPDAFLLFVNGEVDKSLEEYKKNKPRKYKEYENEVEDFKEKLKDIKKSAAKQATITAPKTPAKKKISDKLKNRYEKGKKRQQDALKKLGKINFFGSSGLSNEAIEAVGELVLSQFEQGIYKDATIIDKIREITQGKISEKQIKDVYDIYTIKYDGELRTLTELEKLLKEQEIKDREDSIDLEAELAKERDKLAKLKEKEDLAQKERIDALALQRAQQAVKESEKRISELEKDAKKMASQKTEQGKMPTLSELIQRDLEADLTAEQIAKNLQNEGQLSEKVAKIYADKFYQAYKKILAEKINAELVKSLGLKTVKKLDQQQKETPFSKTLGGQISSEVLAGALDSEVLRNAFKEKYGIPHISPIVADNIRMLSRKVRAAKTRLGIQAANKNLLQYVNANIPTKPISFINTLYYVSILSGVSTAVVNTYSNFNNIINQSTENLISSIIEATQGNKGNLASTKEAKSKIRLAISNFVESMTAATDIIINGGGEAKYYGSDKKMLGEFDSDSLIVNKKDFKDLNLKKFFKTVFKLFKTPAAAIVRNMPASDDAFYMANYNMEAAREVRKSLYKEGFRGKDLENEVYKSIYGTDEIKAQALEEAIKEANRIGINPENRKMFVKRIAKELIAKKLDAEVQRVSDELAQENVYRGKMRGATGLAASVTPRIMFITPFVNTVYRMAEKHMNYIPVYGALRYFGYSTTDIMRGLNLFGVDDYAKRKGIELVKREAEMRNKQLAQVITAHTLMLVLLGLSYIDFEDEEGNIVPLVDCSAGYFGVSKEDRAKLRSTMPEYQIRIGNTMFSYKTNPLLAMIALPLGVAKDAEKGFKKSDYADLFLTYQFSVLTFMYEAVPIQGLEKFFQEIGKVKEIPAEDKSVEDYVKVPVKFIADAGANMVVDNVYKQIFDFVDPTKYEAQDLKEMLYKSVNMEKIGGLVTSHDRWGREVKFYPGERFFPVQHLLLDKTDKEITSWEVKNEINIPKTNRKTLVLTPQGLKSQKSIDKYKRDLELNYGLDSEMYKEYESVLNTDFRTLTYDEWDKLDKTVRSNVYEFIKKNFKTASPSYKTEMEERGLEDYSDTPISKLPRRIVQKLIDNEFEYQRRIYINKNFNKID